MTRLARLWRGELPLASAFWDWAVIGGIVVNGTASIAFFTLLMHDQLIAAFVIGYACSVPYNFIVAVAVWRSAGRYQGDRRWAHAARIVTVIGMSILSVT